MRAMLDRKLWRDLWRLKGQAIAVALVMACGLAMMIMARSLIYSLETTRSEYYEANRFADVFAACKRAPMSLADRIAQLPGVAAVQPGISVQVTLDLEGLDEPASGIVRSLPESGQMELNRLFLRSGDWPSGFSGGADTASRGAERREVLVGEAFAQANNLKPGDTISMLLNGRRQTFRISGIVLSPEYIFESRPGAALPDNRTFGIFWMPYKEVATAFDLYGGFNWVSLTLAPGAVEGPVLTGLDRLLETYGGHGAFGRSEHPSHIRVSDEIRVLSTMAVGFPVVFLSVAAFMINAVLSRLLSLQREQIAILKAFGYTNTQVVFHYLKFALAIVSLGTVLGAVGGLIIGYRIVNLYHRFFRFPDLSFRLDQTAFPIALAVCAVAAAAGVFAAVRRAAKLPPAEAMRPEPPANYRPALVERTGVAHLLSHSFRIAIRNIERKPAQAFFTVAGLALATGILIVPNAFRDGVAEVLDFQWDVVQRQDLGVGLVEPAGPEVQHLFAELPGVITTEPSRAAAVRLGFGPRQRQVAIQGIPANGLHNRVVDNEYRQVLLPKDGLVISTKLAEVLGAKIGDLLRVEELEGKRLSREVRLAGLAGDFVGMAAYMDLESLNRFLEEGDRVSGANFRLDSSKRAEFLHTIKGIPKITWVAIKDSLRENFRQTTAASIGLIQKIYLLFAVVVAFGVVYNNARISLAERARELATLRVIGFTQREVGAVLITELVVLALVAVPLGLLIGTFFAAGILKAVNTETVRLPLVLTASNYSFAVAVVCVASSVSALFVLRKLKHLNLVAVLKAPE